LGQVRRTRDPVAHGRALKDLVDAAGTAGANLMPPILRAVEAYASLGEICGALKTILGEYHEEKTYF